MDQHFDQITIFGGSINAWPTLWESGVPCVALPRDGLSDHRTPALTPTGARLLAEQLLRAADVAETLTADSRRGVVTRIPNRKEAADA